MEADKPADPPDFPDLAPLAASLDAQIQPTPDSPNPSDIWATLPSASKPPDEPTLSVSKPGYDASHAVPAPPPSFDLHDLDPFAPTQGTIGSTVRRDSRLEVIENSESDEGSPVEDRRMRDQQELGKGQQAQGQGATPFSFGNILRSFSGTPTKEREDAPPSQPHPEPSAGHPIASTSSSATPPPPQPSTSRSAPQTPSGPSPLAKPLASIASVFRSSNRPSPSSSNTTTPQPGSSPQREKGTFIAAIAGSGAASKGKEKEKHVDEEKADQVDEKAALRQSDGHGSSSKEREEPVFDFNKFLEQMRSRSADPIAKYLRSCVLVVSAALALALTLVPTAAFSKSFLADHPSRPTTKCASSTTFWISSPARCARRIRGRACSTSIGETIPSAQSRSSTWRWRRWRSSS